MLVCKGREEAVIDALRMSDLNGDRAVCEQTDARGGVEKEGEEGKRTLTMRSELLSPGSALMSHSVTHVLKILRPRTEMTRFELGSLRIHKPAQMGNDKGFPRRGTRTSHV